MHDAEGWSPHDTNGGSRAASGRTAASGTPTPSRTADDRLDALINALTANVERLGVAHDRGSRSGGNNHHTKDVPAELANARQHAGLCIRCGVAKYVPGSRGHHAGLCPASAADLTTTVADGSKLAGQ